MTTVIIPPELETVLADEARRRGTTPELLAVESLRRIYGPAATSNVSNGGSLRDFLQGYIGNISGTSAPLSEQTGRRFTDMLLEKDRQG